MILYNDYRAQLLTPGSTSKKFPSVRVIEIIFGYVICKVFSNSR